MAAAARAQGIIIYCIGLVGSDGVDVDTLNLWATDPDASHVAVTPDAAELEALFAELAANISKPGATNVVIDEVVNSDFIITSSITYSDAESNTVTVPDPVVSVECDVVVNPEPCPVPVDLSVSGCPGKRVALAAILTEVDENGMEYQRGMKAMTIPAHSHATCRDVLVKCIKFVVPDDLDASGSASGKPCRQRNFKARFIAHNVDTDYRCCESALTL